MLVKVVPACYDVPHAIVRGKLFLCRARSGWKCSGHAVERGGGDPYQRWREGV